LFYCSASLPAQLLHTDVYPPNDVTLDSITKDVVSKRKRRNRIKDILLQIVLTWLVMIVAVNNKVVVTMGNSIYTQHQQALGYHFNKYTHFVYIG
jgi:hypothetical protein